MSSMRKRATWLLTIYCVVLAASISVVLIAKDSLIGFNLTWTLGLPWSMIVMFALWGLSHTMSFQQISLLNVVFAVPNLILLFRWIGQMQIEEDVDS